MSRYGLNHWGDVVHQAGPIPLLGGSTNQPVGRLARSGIDPIDQSIEVVVDAEEMVDPPAFEVMGMT